MRWILLLLFTFPAYAQTDDDIIRQLEQLIKSNEELTLKAKELEALQKAHPELELEPLQIIVDKSGRVFVTDSLSGTLKIGNLSYSVNIKLKTTIIKAKKSQFGFNLRPKASVLYSYELDPDDEVEVYASPALSLELFYYRDFNFNLIVGSRMYGAGIGVDITDHFGGIAGIGMKYNDEKAPFLGVAFDF